jgi:hypothetical protein
MTVFIELASVVAAFSLGYIVDRILKKFDPQTADSPEPESSTFDLADVYDEAHAFTIGERQRLIDAGFSETTAEYMAAQTYSHTLLKRRGR